MKQSVYKIIKYPRTVDYNNKAQSVWISRYKKKYRLEFLLKYRGNISITLSKKQMKDLLSEIEQRIKETK
jgi:hypothetical protein